MDSRAGACCLVNGALQSHLKGLWLLFWVQTPQEVGNDQKGTLPRGCPSNPRAGVSLLIRLCRPGFTYGQCIQHEKTISKQSFRSGS